MAQKKTSKRATSESIFRQTKRPAPRTVVGFRPGSSPQTSDLLIAIRELDLQRTELQSQNDELRRTQLQLESSRERFARLYNDAPVGYLTLSMEGRILEANLSSARLLNTTVAHLIGTPLQHLVPPQHQDTLHFHLQSLRSQLDACSCRIELRRLAPKAAINKNRRPSISVQLESRPFSIDHSAPTQILMAVVDVSERELLQREILHTSELERLRVAAELHDGICQEIVGLELLLHAAIQTLPQSSDPARFRPVLEGLRNTADHARRLAHFTNPAVTTGDSIPDALKSLAVRTQQLYRTVCTFNASGTPPKLDSATGSQLLRMVQEAVCNAVKHSRARHIRINLQQSKSQIQLTVSDDGCGFQNDSRLPRYSQKSEGLGLRIMRHRANLIGARLSIQSIPEKGTLVRFFLQCPPQKTTAKKGRRTVNPSGAPEF